jgi:hypothetical protein
MALSDKEQLKLKKFKEKLKETQRESIAKIERKAKENVTRTGSRKTAGASLGQGVRQGKPKTISGRVNFTIPKVQGGNKGELVKSTARKIVAKGAPKTIVSTSKELVPSASRSVVPHFLKRSAPVIGKGLLRGLAGTVGMFMQDDVGEGSDVIPPEARPQPYREVATGIHHKDTRSVLDLASEATQRQIAKEIINSPEETTSKAADMDRKSFNTIVDNQAAPDAVKEIIHSMPPRQIEMKQAEIQQKKAEGKELGLVDSFLDSLTFFLPTALGAAIGGAFEGSEGAVAGAQQATALAQAKREFDLKQEELSIKRLKELKEGSALDLDKTANFQHKVTGEPIWQGVKEGNRGVLVDSRGNEIDPKDVVDIGTARARENQTSIDRRHYSGKSDRQNRVIDSAFKGFVNRTDIMSMRESRLEIQRLKKLLDSGKPITEGFISTWVAKGLQGQAGMLSDKDVIRAKIPINVGQSAISAVKEFFAGDMSDSKKRAAKELFKVMSDTNEELIMDSIKGFSTKGRAKRLGLTVDEIEQELKDTLGVVDLSRKRKRLKELRAKLRAKDKKKAGK